MNITTISSRKFNQDVSRAKRIAFNGGVTEVAEIDFDPVFQQFTSFCQ